MTSLDPHWDHTHQWSLVYPGCATPCLAQVLCMVRHWPLSYLLPKNWEKPLISCLCNHSVRNMAEDFGKISSAVFFASAQRQGECMRTLLNTTCSAGDRKSLNRGCDMLQLTGHWLIAHHPSAQVCKQNGWQGMMWLVELAWNFSERAVPWTWQGDVWHGSWIYRTGPYSPKQVKDMTIVFFVALLDWCFLHKS